MKALKTKKFIVFTFLFVFSFLFTVGCGKKETKTLIGTVKEIRVLTKNSPKIIDIIEFNNTKTHIIKACTMIVEIGNKDNTLVKFDVLKANIYENAYKTNSILLQKKDDIIKILFKNKRYFWNGIGGTEIPKKHD